MNREGSTTIYILKRIHFATSGEALVQVLGINMSYVNLGARCYSKIGFVGLGNMGGHMARNLLKKVIESYVR